jgi:hypothetical protein
MGRPRVPVVKVGGERVSDVRIGPGRGFEQGFLHVSRKVGPLLEHRATQKLFEFHHGASVPFRAHLDACLNRGTSPDLAWERLPARVVFGRFSAHRSLTETADVGSEARVGHHRLAFHPALQQHVASAVSYVFYDRPEAGCHLFAIAAGILSWRFDGTRRRARPLYRGIFAQTPALRTSGSDR